MPTERSPGVFWAIAGGFLSDRRGVLAPSIPLCFCNLGLKLLILLWKMIFRKFLNELTPLNVNKLTLKTSNVYIHTLPVLWGTVADMAIYRKTIQIHIAISISNLILLSLSIWLCILLWPVGWCVLASASCVYIYVYIYIYVDLAIYIWLYIWR